MIGRMVPEDLDEVIKIEQASFQREAWTREDMLYELENPFAFLFTDKRDGQLAGYIGVRDLYERLEITTLAVAEPFRRRGIGGALLEHVLELAKKEGYRNITLEVRVSNQAAINLYQRYGFEVWAVKKDYYLSGHEDAYLMGTGDKS